MKKFSFQFLIPVLFIPILFTCNIEKGKISSADLSNEILKNSDDYFNAVRSENADSVLSFWTNDLRVITGQQDILGIDALRKFLEVFYQSSDIHELSVLGREIHASDSLAVEIVEYSEIVSSNDNKMRTIQGKQIQVWKMINEKWRISHMAFIPILPAMAPNQ
jgi:ketosteroid isomerase-like protein